jgi:hypothetical protein
MIEIEIIALFSDEISGCSDRSPSEKITEFSDFWNRTISFSDEACQRNDIQKNGQILKSIKQLITRIKHAHKYLQCYNDN